MRVQSVLNALAVFLFLLAALGVAALDNALESGLALFAAAHLPWAGLGSSM